nr:GAF domain-containing protein [Streptomyces sp. 846.5]
MEPIAVPAADPAHPVALELLQSIVDVARAIFGAQASSVFLLDEETGELVFRAVSGQGEEFLVGRRFPAGQGIAGWVAVSGESIVVDDLTANSAFDRSLAQSTQFVPDALMAAPLVHGDQVLGVLEILDPSAQARSGLPELDLLSMFARQAAIALRIVTADRAATTTDAHAMSPGRRTAAAQLIRELERLLEIQ